jgi:hypothetical protein
MNKTLVLILSFAVLLIGALSIVNAVTIISNCTTINSPGSYVLNQSITSTASCLTINASNLLLDCAGNIVTYGTAGTASSFGINAVSTVAQTNLTIKNCILVKPSVLGASGRGISLTRFANSNILNNTILTNGTSSNVGIYTATSSDIVNISRNTIITSGTSSSNYGVYLYSGSTNSTIDYNIITAGKGTATTDNYGIYSSDPRANITNNIIYTFGSGDSNYGILSYTSTSTRIVNNSIYTSGTTGNNRGVYASTSDSNYIANNTINTTGQASPGIYLSSSGLPNILNNKINSTADAVYITSATLTDYTLANISRDNKRYGRNITVYGGGSLTLPCPNNTIIDNPPDGALKFFNCNNITVRNWYRPNRDTDGLLFVNSDYNKIINNTINGGIEGLDMVLTAGMCDNNTIANNTFSSFGYIDAYAIHIYGNDNVINGNNLSTSGVTSGNNGINIQNDFNNITNNIITTAGTSTNIGINFETGAINNFVQNNTITTSGTSGNDGIYFVSACTGNVIRNNTITTTGITSGNLGIRLVTNSNNNTVEYNKFYTEGLTSGNNGIDLSSSSNNVFRYNNVYSGYGVGTTDNDAISLVSSKNNTFIGNILFANGTAASITSSPIFLQSSSTNNLFVNNTIVMSVGNAIEIDFSATYPSGNIFQNNSLSNVSGSDLFFMDANINNTLLINQPIGRYNFTGVGGTLSIENTQFGKIIFLSQINGTGLNMSNDIQIKSDFVQVNPLQQGLNETANVNLYNLPTNFYNPLIKRDGLYECNATTAPSCVNFTSLNAGNVSFSVTAWSNYSVVNSTDVIFPSIFVFSPQNTTYTQNSVFLNYSVSDNLAVGSCWYIIDSSSNISLPGCSTATVSGLTDGGHKITVYVNDSTGNLNYSSVLFSVVSSPPQWSNMQASTPSFYSGILSFFNTTWTSVNTIQSVLFESNLSGTPANYTMYSLGGSVYGFNLSIPAGTFYWKSYSNDTYGNLNSSSIQIFTINKADNSLDIYINGNKNQNLTLGYGIQINVTAQAFFGTASLTRDGVLVSNPEINILGANSMHNYTASILETQNYTSNLTSFFVIINKTVPAMNLLVNGVPSDLAVDYGVQTNVSASETNFGDSDVIYSLYKDGNLLGTGNSVDSEILAAGNYTYIYNSTEGLNYTSNIITRKVNVNKVTPVLHLFLNSVEGNFSLVYGTGINITGKSNQIVSLKLLRDGNEVATGKEVFDNSDLAAGVYNYTLIFDGDNNYTSVSVSYLLVINKSVPELILLLNGESSDLSISVGENLQVNASSLIPLGESVDLYEDSILQSSGNFISLLKNYSSVGSRTWKVSFSENKNYTSKDVSYNVAVLDPDAPHYSNLRVSPISDSAYVPKANYQFTSTWIDNVAVSDVIFSFNNFNYTFLSGQLQKDGNDYLYSLSDLSAGTYTYKWWANDTSGNLVSTPVQNYVVEKGIAALFLTMSPSNSVNYGTTTSVSCASNNAESSLAINRNSVLVSNPDVFLFRFGNYNYACTSVATQNYTSASVTGTLVVNKASPILNLVMNGFSRDLLLPSDGGLVEINVTLVKPAIGNISLLIDGNLVDSGNSFVQNTTFFYVVGNHTINAVFVGDENYSFGLVSYNIFVSSPPVSSSSSSGGGGSGGGSSGGGGVVVSSQKKILESGTIQGIVVNTGGVRKISSWKVKNVGTSFLNDCKFKGVGDLSSWITHQETKGLAAGESYDFVFDVNIPENINPGKYNLGVNLQCQEANTSSGFVVEVTEKQLNFNLTSVERDGKTNVKAVYSIQELSGKDQEVTVQFLLYDSNDKKVAEVSEVKTIPANSIKDFETLIPIDQSLSGNLGLLINFNSQTYSGFVQEKVVLGNSVSGFTIFSAIGNNDNIISIVLVLLFLLFTFLVVRRIRKHKYHARNRAIKIIKYNRNNH